MIRPAFAAKLKSLRKRQQGLGYKPMWVYYQILEHFPDITFEEVQAVGAELDYKPRWADYKWMEIEESRSQDSEHQHQHQDHKQEQQSRQQSGYRSQPLEQEFEEWLRAWGYGTYGIPRSETNSDRNNSAPPFLRHHLQILELDWPTTLQEVKQSYRRLAKQLHPDVGGSKEQFINLGKSYEVVSGYLR